jgi:hypothetical protein
MVLNSELRSTRTISREGAISVTILILVVWFGNFSEFTRFSLYADDWAYLGWEFRTTWSVVAWFYGIIPYASGRPLQWSLIYLSGAMISYFGSLAAGYILLFIVTTTSVLVTWWALTYRFSNAVALTAAAVFAMSPLVSIRPFINGIATPAAFIFLMLAGVFYVTDRRVLSYFVAALVLLSYELVFPLFVLLPTLLKPLRTRGDIYRLIGHSMICAAMVAAEAFSLRFYGDGRLQGAIAGKSEIDLGLGIVRAAFLSVPNGLVGSADISLWLHKIHGMAGVEVWCVFAFGTSAFLLNRAVALGGGVGSGGRWLVAQTVAVLLVMTLAGYGLTYFVSIDGADPVLGRSSRFHSAASLPLGIMTGLVLIGLLRAARRGWSRHAMVAVTAGFLALMFAFSVSHQAEFAMATERQRLVVTQLVLDHPMMDPHATFIIRFADVDPQDMPAIEYEDRHSWYPLLQHLFDFRYELVPEDGPIIRIVHDDFWSKQLTLRPNGQLDWQSGAWPVHPEHLGHVWYYELTLDGELKPLNTPLMVDGRNILGDGSDSLDGAVDLRHLGRSPLFALVMGPDAALVDAALRKEEPPPMSTVN